MKKLLIHIPTSYIHKYIQTYTRTCIHTYRHKYVRIYRH